MNFDFKNLLDEETKQKIRKYRTDDVLRWIFKESCKIYKGSSGMPGAEMVSFNSYAKGSTLPVRCEYIIQAWTLIDLAYVTIDCSNDYRKGIITRDEELYALCSLIDNAKDCKVADIIGEDQETLMFYIFGIAGEQLKLQNPAGFYENLGRELYIIFEVAKRCNPQYDFSELVMEEIGVTWREVVIMLFLGHFAFMLYGTLEQVLCKVAFKDDYAKESFKKVIDHYTATYEEVRQASIERQYLYKKPYIKTQNNSTVIISPYLCLAHYEHCIYWLIRDYFKKRNSQDFTNFFGPCFEEYFSKVLEDCLEKFEYEKIIETNEKRADWIINIGGFKFLIEQKSAILYISVKQQISDVDAFKRYSAEKIIEALKQLEVTERSYNNGKYIKIILLYEDYVNPGILKDVFNLPDCDVIDDGYYWLANIDEMEKLLTLSKNNKELFTKIVNEKIRRETTSANEGKGIDYILSEFGIVANAYIDSTEEIKRYVNLGKEGMREIVKN